MLARRRRKECSRFSTQLCNSTVFLALVAVLVMIAKFIATRRPIAEILERWEHILFPIVLIGLGIFILISGGAFGL